VQPLKREQVWGRLVHEARQRAFRRIPPLLPFVLGMPDAPGVAVKLPEPVQDPESLARAETALRHGTAVLAGHEVGVRDWGRTDVPKLVRYHLHYLDLARDLVEAGRFAHREDLTQAGLALARDWSVAHPPRGGEAWEPYPVSARLQNLCVLAATAGADCPDWLRRQAELHARYVAAFPEEHLQGNHLLKNACALAVAGLCFEGDGTRERELLGLSRVEAEVARQVLPDGGHDERSVMYHLLAMADLLDVRDFAQGRSRAVPWLEDALERMARFAAHVLHPDGELPLFNDAVLGQAPPPAKLFARLGRVPQVDPARIFDTPDFGLTVFRPTKEEALFFDSGPLGPLHQSGHAHSDTLSYELSIAGARRAVNGGVDGYQSANRAFFRSAVAHNTVTVDGLGPDELWGAFRVGGRCRVVSRAFDDRLTYLWARAKLEAYQGWSQERTLALFPGQALIVVDAVEAKRAATVVSRARLLPGNAPVRFVPLAGDASQRGTAYAPEFNKVFDIAEHSVRGAGRQVRLAYALAWGSADPLALAAQAGLS